MACHYGPKYFVDEEEYGDHIKYYGGTCIVAMELVAYISLLVWGTIQVVLNEG